MAELSLFVDEVFDVWFNGSGKYELISRFIISSILIFHFIHSFILLFITIIVNTELSMNYRWIPDSPNIFH